METIGAAHALAARHQKWAWAVVDGAFLRKVNCFVAAATRGSFTAAAADMRLSQPSLGLHVRELEQRYDVVLFDRNGRGAKLTAAGRDLLPQARALLAEVEKTDALLRSLSGKRIVKLSLGITPTAQATLAPHLLEGCDGGRAGLDLVLVPGLSEDLRRKVEISEIDATFYYGLPDARLDRSTALYSEDLYVIGKGGALGQGQTVDLFELQALPLVLERRHQIFRRVLDAAVEERRLPLNVRYEVEPVDAKRALIRRHNVFAIAPLGLFLDEIESGEMGAWRIVSPHLRVSLFLTRRPGLPDELVRSLEEQVRASVASVVASGRLSWDQSI